MGAEKIMIDILQISLGNFDAASQSNGLLPNVGELVPFALDVGKFRGQRAATVIGRLVQNDGE